MFSPFALQQRKVQSEGKHAANKESSGSTFSVVRMEELRDLNRSGFNSDEYRCRENELASRNHGHLPSGWSQKQEIECLRAGKKNACCNNVNAALAVLLKNNLTNWKGILAFLLEPRRVGRTFKTQLDAKKWDELPFEALFQKNEVWIVGKSLILTYCWPAAPECQIFAGNLLGFRVAPDLYRIDFSVPTADELKERMM